jgi:hypothetical protein
MTIIKFDEHKYLFKVLCSFRWNLAYTDAYADLLWEKNIVSSLKSTTKIVQADMILEHDSWNSSVQFC